MLIGFNPLKIENVTLPHGSAFVITHSLTESNKAASNHFNTRVYECRLATQVLTREYLIIAFFCFKLNFIYLKVARQCKGSRLAFDL